MHRATIKLMCFILYTLVLATLSFESIALLPRNIRVEDFSLNSMRVRTRVAIEIIYVKTRNVGMSTF